MVEDHFLVCEREALDTPATQALGSLLASEGWREQVARLAGCSAQGAGEIVSPRRALPW